MISVLNAFGFNVSLYLTQPGLEPAVFALGEQRLIHWATGPYSPRGLWRLRLVSVEEFPRNLSYNSDLGFE
ncbi:unnamed protein product [Enterobius vermicularis]|uniref:P/Homo B domain-containing protein n=1 Tax=Enterobius vermicularis TaxID=51028 RepID=A0A0N4VHB8_ENTVE|nr:unnamed protein product [Enterobius vermicularis]